MINLPLLDIKPHREIHTAEETRNLYYDGEILFPKAKLWADEPGYYFSEFPIYNSIVASFYTLTHTVDETWGRLLSVFASVGVVYFFYVFTKKYWGYKIALWAALFFYVFSPQEIILSRSFQPDQLGLFFGMSFLYYFSEWVDRQKKRYWLLSFILFTLALLTKVQFFSFGFPALYLGAKKWQSKIFRKPLIYLFCLSSLPFLFWWQHIRNTYQLFPQLHSAVLLNPLGWIDLRILGDIHWYVNVGFDFIEQISTIPVFLLALLGIFIKVKNDTKLLYAWYVGLLMYIILFLGKFHFWYYQVPLLFPTTVFAAIAMVTIMTNIREKVRYQKFMLFILVIVSACITARPYLLRTYKVADRHRAVIQTAKFIKSVAAKDSKIVTSSYNSAALTYYSLRPDMWGATFDINQNNCTGDCTIEAFEKLIKWGATLYGVSDKQEFIHNPTFLQYLNTTYPILLETNDAVVYDLNI